MSQTNVIAAAHAVGFEFHHAEGQYAMLHKWMREGKSLVPPFATHNVGVGGIVVDDRDRLLLVRDRSRKAVGWKFPGGLSDLGEDFGQTAEREVLEETGVKTSFRSVLALRQQHGMAFGRSDIFVLCRLRPETTDINLDPQEIEACEWLPAASFLAETLHPLNYYTARMAVMEARAERAALAGSTATASQLVQGLPSRTFTPPPEVHPGPEEVLAFQAGRAVGTGMVCERVYIPSTQRFVKVYHAAASNLYPCKLDAGKP